MSVAIGSDLPWVFPEVLGDGPVDGTLNSEPLLPFVVELRTQQTLVDQSEERDLVTVSVDLPEGDPIGVVGKSRGQIAHPEPHLHELFLPERLCV